jgi:hypothetical protein
MKKRPRTLSLLLTTIMEISDHLVRTSQQYEGAWLCFYFNVRISGARNALFIMNGPFNGTMLIERGNKGN